MGKKSRFLPYRHFCTGVRFWLRTGAQGDGADEAVGASGEEESVDSLESRCNARLKKRVYWKKVQRAIREKRDNKKYSTRILDFVSESPEVESESETIDVEDVAFTGYKEPRVTLLYGDDYEAVRNLPRRRVKGWPGRGLGPGPGRPFPPW